MAPRIAPVDDPDQEQRAALSKAMAAPDGEPLNLFKTLAHLPQLMRRTNALGGYFMVHGSIPLREREIVVLRVASLSDSDYEIGQHRWIGDKAGLTTAEIEAALDSGIDHPWSVEERALLAFAEELVATGTVSDETWSSLDGIYDELVRVELIMMVGFYRMIAGVLNGLGVELDESVAAAVA